MAWILQTRAYGLKLCLTTTATGEVFWENDRLNYRHLSFTMTQFREMIWETFYLAKKSLLCDALLLEASQLENPLIPCVPLTRIRNNMSNNEVGSWYGKVNENSPFPTTEESETWLLSRIFEHENLREQFITYQHGRGDQWNTNAISRWLKSVYHFKGILLVLMHFTAGAPARVHELLSIRYINSVPGGLRNQFIDNGLFSFVTRYHKGYSISRNTKVIQRFVPSEVGQLFLLFETLAIPMQWQIEAVVHETYGSTGNSFLWPNREANGFTWHSERITSTIRKLSEPWLGGDLTLSSYRHIAIAIGRRYLRPDAAGFVGDTEDDAEENADEEGLEWNRSIAYDLQAAHSRNTAEKFMEEKGINLQAL